MYREKDNLRKVANYMSAHDNEGILVLKPGSKSGLRSSQDLDWRERAKNSIKKEAKSTNSWSLIN